VTGRPFTGEKSSEAMIYLLVVAMASPALGCLQPCADSLANDALPGNMAKERVSS